MVLSFAPLFASVHSVHSFTGKQRCRVESSQCPQQLLLDNLQVGQSVWRARWRAGQFKLTLPTLDQAASCTSDWRAWPSLVVVVCSFVHLEKLRCCSAGSAIPQAYSFSEAWHDTSLSFRLRVLEVLRLRGPLQHGKASLGVFSSWNMVYPWQPSQSQGSLCTPQLRKLALLIQSLTKILSENRGNKRQLHMLRRRISKLRRRVFVSWPMEFFSHEKCHGMLGGVFLISFQHNRKASKCPELITMNLARIFATKSVDAKSSFC